MLPSPFLPIFYRFSAPPQPPPRTAHAVCSVRAVGLDSNVALLVAALDLKLVQLVRGAMAAADAGAAKHLGKLVGPAPAIAPRPVLHPQPRIEPREVIHPTPRIEPREVLHPAPRVVEPPPVYCCPPCPPERARCTPPVFVPPWKVVPWENPPQPLPNVKLIKPKPDIVRKGSLIDCFI